LIWLSRREIRAISAATKRAPRKMRATTRAMAEKIDPGGWLSMM
jgi:hypothetical protein